MRHSIRKSSVQCLHANRSWILSFRSLASEPAIQNIESCTKTRTRWSLQETMVLIAAKKKQELQLQKAGIQNKLKSREKWEEIESTCQAEGIERTAQQCRQRWDRIVPIYLKVKDWEKRITSEGSSFWLMKPNERKAEGFQLVLDREVFDALDEYSNQLESCSTASIVVSKERRVEDEYHVDEKQGGLSGAETVGYAQVSSSIGPHKCTSEASMGTESQRSNYLLQKHTHGKQEGPDDVPKGNEKNQDDKNQIAMANVIDKRLNDLRVEGKHTAGISLDCQVFMENEAKQQGVLTHSYIEDQREEAVVTEHRSVLQNETLSDSMEMDKGIHREEIENSFNDGLQIATVCTEETTVEEDEKVGADVHQCPHGSPSITLKEEISSMTHNLDPPGFDNFTKFLAREMDPNTEEKENDDRKYRRANLFHATKQKDETVDMTNESLSVNKDCNDNFLNQLKNEVCQEKSGADIQHKNASTVDRKRPVAGLKRSMVVHVNDSTEECIMSAEMRQSIEQVMIENSNYENECLGTGSATVSGEVPVMTEGRIPVLVNANEGSLKEIKINKETCNQRKENAQKLGSGPDPGSSLHHRGEIAHTEQASKTAAKDGNDKPIISKEGSEKGLAKHQSEFDDDVFRGIQSAIGNMTSSALQSIRRFFGH